MSPRAGKRRVALALGALASLACTAVSITDVSAAPAAAAFACQVDYSTNDWGAGFSATVSISNRGASAANGWSPMLRTCLPQGNQLALWSTSNKP